VRTFFGVDAPKPACKIGWVRVPGGAILEIFEFQPQLPPGAIPWNRVGLTHFSFNVRNTQKWYDYLVSKGVECLSKPERETLIGLLRRRFHALHGEIRLLPGRFELVSVGELAGVAPAMSDEVWFGRALVLNAPLGPLAAWLEASGGAPDFLPTPPVLRHRGWTALKVPRDAVPEGMARRVIHVRDARAPLEAANLVRIGIFPEKAGREVQVVASYLMPPGEDEAVQAQAEVTESLLELMPFARARARRVAPMARPHWDDELALEDPAPGAGWPSEVELRLLAKPPVYRLPREEVGVLGVEGDCLLGWRAGDAILSDLT
jgi:hypothetical protein